MTDMIEEDVTDFEEEEVEYLNIVRFNLFGYIDGETAAAFVDAMWEKDNEDTSSVWEIVINSEGGDMEAGTAIYSEIASYSERGGGSHYVFTKVRGQAASCASLILQAGDYRMAGRMDYIMSHEPLLSFEDATMQRVKDELSQAQSWTDNFLDILAERGKKDRAYYSKELCGGRDWWVGSTKAYNIGLVDEIG